MCDASRFQRFKDCVMLLGSKVPFSEMLTVSWLQRSISSKVCDVSWFQSFNDFECFLQPTPHGSNTVEASWFQSSEDCLMPRGCNVSLIKYVWCLVVTNLRFLMIDDVSWFQGFKDLECFSAPKFHCLKNVALLGSKDSLMLLGLRVALFKKCWCSLVATFHFPKLVDVSWF